MFLSNPLSHAAFNIISLFLSLLHLPFFLGIAFCGGRLAPLSLVPRLLTTMLHLRGLASRSMRLLRITDSFLSFQPLAPSKHYPTSPSQLLYRLPPHFLSCFLPIARCVPPRLSPRPRKAKGTPWSHPTPPRACCRTSTSSTRTARSW